MQIVPGPAQRLQAYTAGQHSSMKARHVAQQGGQQQRWAAAVRSITQLRENKRGSAHHIEDRRGVQEQNDGQAEARGAVLGASGLCWRQNGLHGCEATEPASKLLTPPPPPPPCNRADRADAGAVAQSSR